MKAIEQKFQNYKDFKHQNLKTNLYHLKNILKICKKIKIIFIILLANLKNL